MGISEALRDIEVDRDDLQAKCQGTLLQLLMEQMKLNDSKKSEEKSNQKKYAPTSLNCEISEKKAIEIMRKKAADKVIMRNELKSQMIKREKYVAN